MRRFVSTVGIAAIALIVSAAPAAATPRTWVAHNGLSSNTGASPPCNPQAPCDTFATALTVTDAGGEINCVDNASYGAVSITQSVTIDCDGQLGAIDVSGSATAVTINGAGIAVKLRKLTINGHGTGNGSGGFGVSIQNAAAVTIESCVIQNFNGGSTTPSGILVQPTGSLQLTVTDTLVANNGGGVVVSPGGGATVRFVLDRVHLVNNSFAGVSALGTGNGVIQGFVRDSVLSGRGILAAANSNTALVAVSSYRSHLVSDAGNGAFASAQNGAAVILSETTIQGNNAAISASGGGVVFTYGNNDLDIPQMATGPFVTISRH